MSKTGHGFPEGSQNLSPLALFLLLPPQAVKENGSLAVSITLATGYVTSMHGTHPAVGTWRVDITPATVALPFASLGVCLSVLVEFWSFFCCWVMHGSASLRVAPSFLWEQQRQLEVCGSLLEGSGEAVCESVLGPLLSSLADPGLCGRAHEAGP